MLCGCSGNEPATFYDGSGQLAITLDIEPVMVGGVALPMPAPEEFALTLKSAASGSSFTWHSIADFTQSQRYISGPYEATATKGNCLSEGFGQEFYKGTAAFNVDEGTLNEVSIPVSLISALVGVQTDAALQADFPAATIVLQSEGGSPVSYPPGENRLGALKPGAAFAAVNLGQGLSFLMPERFSFASATPYHITAIYDAATKHLSIDDGAGRKSAVELTPEALASEPPAISLTGAENDIPLNVIEFTSTPQPLVFSVDNASTATLSINSETLSSLDAPTAIDIMSPSTDEVAWMNANGVVVSRIGHSLRVDLTDLPAHIPFSSTGTNTTRLSVIATNPYNRVASPAPRVDLEICAATIQVMEVSPAVIGDNSALLTIASPLALDELRSGLSVRTLDSTPVEITSITSDAEVGRYIVAIKLGAGTENVDIELLYRGDVRAHATIPRSTPDYDVQADAFAKRAILKFSSSDRATTAYIVNHATVTIDGQTAARIQSRNPQNATIEIIGLQPSTRYTIATQVVSGTPDGEQRKEMEILTERAPQLPNADFEDAKDRIDWHDLPAGGPYSQTQVAIYSQQNHTSYKLKAPEKWANTNPKTFFTGSKTPNTWYMQPSVWTTETPKSGDRAVRLVSVAFDPAGKPIPPYRQEDEPFTPYSRNIPEIAYRAAGKIFLGSYAYNPQGPEEGYTEGIEFQSRPTSLNGWYRYTPSAADPSDTGVAVIEVIADTPDGPVVIASGSTRLPLAADYTAFTIPLDYSANFAVKASGLKLMVASSADIGDIPYESLNIKTLSDPASSTSLGSVLDLDNLTLAY